jgi:hypothetical protein
MTALAADRNTPIREGDLFSYPVAAATKIYAGSLVVLDAAGNAEPCTAAASKIAVGRAEEYVYNTGAAAAKSIQVRRGTFRWVNGDSVTKTSIGDTAYGFDDQTVKKAAAGLSACGIIVDVDAGGVWVCTDPGTLQGSTGLLAANNLSDVGTVATARASLGLDTGDSPTFAAATITGAAAMGSSTSVGTTTGRQKTQTVAGSAYLVTTADGGIVISAAADNDVVTLPDAAAGNKGLRVTVVNVAADDAAKVSISPHSSDKIVGTVAAVTSGGVADKDWINTKVGANKGDYTTLVSDGTDTWYIVGGVGVWASE